MKATAIYKRAINAMTIAAKTPAITEDTISMIFLFLSVWALTLPGCCLFCFLAERNRQRLMIKNRIAATGIAKYKNWIKYSIASPP